MIETRAVIPRSFFQARRLASVGFILTLALSLGSMLAGGPAQAQREQALKKWRDMQSRAVETFHCVYADVEAVLYSQHAADTQPGIQLWLLCDEKSELVTIVAPPGFQKEIVDIGLTAISTGKKVLIVLENGKLFALGLVSRP